jgi:hypothetical protein
MRSVVSGERVKDEMYKILYMSNNLKICQFATFRRFFLFLALRG